MLDLVLLMGLVPAITSDLWGREVIIFYNRQPPAQQQDSPSEQTHTHSSAHLRASSHSALPCLVRAAEASYELFDMKETAWQRKASCFLLLPILHVFGKEKYFSKYDVWSFKDDKMNCSTVEEVHTETHGIGTWKWASSCPCILKDCMLKRVPLLQKQRCLRTTSPCSHGGVQLTRCLLEVQYSREETVQEAPGMCGRW